MEERIKQLVAYAFAIMLLPLLSPAIAQVQSTVSPALPSLTPGEAGEKTTGDADAIYCRPPQQLPGQRIYGPKVCKPQRQWDDLHRQGLDIGADCQSVGASEKYRTLKGCNSAVAC
jgi:hypothetical protein